MNKITAKKAALEIVNQMSQEDKETFTPDKWIEGVGHMLVDEWNHLDRDEVIFYISWHLTGDVD